MSILEKDYVVTMPDGSRYAVPVRVIAEHRSRYFAIVRGEYGGDVQQHVTKDTLPLFESSPFEIHDWAANNMNWSEVCDCARLVTGPEDVDFDDGWANGEYALS